jgi:hypothetical protein
VQINDVLTGESPIPIAFMIQHLTVARVKLVLENDPKLRELILVEAKREETYGFHIK